MILPLQLGLKAICDNPNQAMHFDEFGNLHVRLDSGRRVGNPKKSPYLPVDSRYQGKSALEILEAFLMENPEAELQLSGDPNMVTNRFAVWYSGRIKNLKIPEDAKIENGMLCFLSQDDELMEIAELLPLDNYPLGVLYQNPAYTLRYDVNGRENWEKTDPRVQKPGIPINSQAMFNGYTAEQVIESIAACNPGTILQLDAVNGVLPCMTLKLNGKDPEELWLPDNALYWNGAISIHCGDKDVSVCILNTEK